MEVGGEMERGRWEGGGREMERGRRWREGGGRGGEEKYTHNTHQNTHFSNIYYTCILHVYT